MELTKKEVACFALETGAKAVCNIALPGSSAVVDVVQGMYQYSQGKFVEGTCSFLSAGIDLLTFGIFSKAKTPAKAAAKKSAIEAAKSMSKEATNTISKDAANKIAQGGCKQTISNAAKASSKKASKEIGQQLAKELSKGMLNEAHKTALYEVKKSALKTTAKKAVLTGAVESGGKDILENIVKKGVSEIVDQNLLKAPTRKILSYTADASVAGAKKILSNTNKITDVITYTKSAAVCAIKIQNSNN